MKGHASEWDDLFIMRSLTFISSQHTFGSYGEEEEGAPFVLLAAGGRIIGFQGRFSLYLNVLGTYIKMDT